MKEAHPFKRYVVESVGESDEYPDPSYDTDDLKDAKNHCKEGERIYDLIEHKYVFDRSINYKAKYEKCIEIIKRFDPGIISMYDL